MKTITIKAHQIIEGDLLQNGLHFDRVDDVSHGSLDHSLKVSCNYGSITRFFACSDLVRVRR